MEEGNKNSETGLIVAEQSSTLPEAKPFPSSSDDIQDNKSERYIKYYTGISKENNEQFTKELKAYNDLVIKKSEEKVKEYIRKLKNDENKLEIKVEEFNKQTKSDIENSKLSVIETLGIFVALFTFISIDIQILKSSIAPSVLIGFIFITLGSLSFFILCLNVLVTKSREDVKSPRFIILFILTLCLLAGGIWLVNKTNQSMYVIFDKEQFKNDYLQSVDKNSKDIQDFKDCLKKGWQKICFN